jgi:hypothetical protein
MSCKAMEEWDRALDDRNGGKVPEVSYENVTATFARLLAQAGTIAEDAIVGVFEALPRDYVTNHRFKLGKRVIFDYAFDGKNWATLHYDARAARFLADLERVMLRLDGQPVTERCAAIDAINVSMRPGDCAWPAVSRTPYFELRAFKKGSIHVHILRDDLVRAMNRVLATHYGDVLPDDHETTEKARPAPDLDAVDDVEAEA